ncbi:MAG: type II secretion system F family protein [SAR324 cluster bacterium]|nr:type II secretion system F family protein [SAR324 cluster bacterium]
MPHYLWKGVNVYGHPLEGAVESPSIENVLEDLRKNDVFRVRFNRIFAYRLQTPLRKEYLVLFLNQFHRLLVSGLELVDCLNFVIRYQTNTFFCYILCALREDIQQGKSMTEAFQRHKLCFPPIFIHLIEVAERSDNLEKIIREMLDFFSFQERFSRERRKLLTYPVIVSGIAFFLFLGIILFVIPTFKTLFISQGSELPVTTRGMIFLSDSLRYTPEYWGIVSLALIAGAVFLFRYLDWSRILLLIPGFRSVEKSIHLLFYARSMLIMLKSGIKLRESLSLAETLFPVRLQKEIREVHQQIDFGVSLVDAYGSSTNFPPVFVHLVAVGESSGHLVPTFERIAVLYQEKLERRMNLINSLIEPLFTVVLAMGILLVLLSIYLPIFDFAGRI